MSTQTVSRARPLKGTASVPADKSVSHRAALLAALSDGRTTLHGFPRAADPQSTLSCLRQLGVSIDVEGDTVHIDGVGLHGLQAPSEPVDCGNSGTTMRLLAGILAGQPFDSTLTGDESLRARPMERIATPLRQMDAAIRLTNGTAPIHISGRAEPLHAITYRLPMASAQVKSCVLLAGLYAEGTTTVVEPVQCRDHTERMLDLPIEVDDSDVRHIHVTSEDGPVATTWAPLPGDFSSAAFLLVAATLVPESEVTIADVGLNPTRTGLLDVLQAMGADLTVTDRTETNGEPMGTITARYAALEGITVEGAAIPNLIDEIPVLSVAAACAEGTTVIRDAAELRVKETDRLEAIAEVLTRMGVSVSEQEDGLTIVGDANALAGATVRSFHDHRIAMAAGVAGCVAEGETTIQNAESARVSFPAFWDVLHRLQG
ncbi:MAG: 3-phosphoshikimate 1-carboxyvinyltransferase [Longimonas sp.]|uniref:3-phosphoshikimate 1-carboxyvinyltransferase n=1 Tax=Longimonas sp. TaxID=2039626 RepID=UPI0033624094